MSSIMRARSALTGRFEDWEVIGGSSLKPKVAGPSMLGIGCPDRHPLPLIHSPPPSKIHRPRRADSRESGFVRCPISDIGRSGRRLPTRWSSRLQLTIRTVAGMPAYGNLAKITQRLPPRTLYLLRAVLAR